MFSHQSKPDQTTSGVTNRQHEAHTLLDIRLLIDVREDDSASSWIAARPYIELLEEARRNCPPRHHVMTSAEYIALWRATVKEMGSRACNEADVWARFASDRDTEHPLSFVRHPFLSTVLVDTYLTDWSLDGEGRYTALVVVGGKAEERVVVPPTGKIYEMNEYGIPARTGGRKITDSDAFEHRWWAFSSDQIRGTEGINASYKMALFSNGGTVGCFCELLKAHYSLDDAGGFYRILGLPDPS